MKKKASHIISWGVVASFLMVQVGCATFRSVMGFIEWLPETEPEDPPPDPE